MKINSVIIIVILFIAVSTCSAQVFNNSNQKIENWTGSIRIEGKTNTEWAGIVTVSDSNISVKNVNSGEIEQHYISFPSVLGAFDEASKIHGFSYTVDYWPDWDAYIIKSVDPKDINDLVVILKTPEDIEKEEEEAEKKIKDAEAEKDAMMGLGDMGTGPDQKDIDVEI